MKQPEFDNAAVRIWITCGLHADLAALRGGCRSGSWKRKGARKRFDREGESPYDDEGGQAFRAFSRGRAIRPQYEPVGTPSRARFSVCCPLVQW